MKISRLLGGLLGAGICATAAYAATQTLTLGTSTGPGGVIVLFGSTSGSATIATPAVAGTTTFTLPLGNGSNTNVLSTDGSGNTSWAAAAGASATTLATGTSVSLSTPREYYVCTGTCTVTPPVPAAGYEFCVFNDDNVATVITLAALGSSARYEATARTSYGSAGTGTIASGGAAGDKICIVGRDSTHYLTISYNGTWTLAN